MNWRLFTAWAVNVVALAGLLISLDQTQREFKEFKLSTETQLDAIHELDQTQIEVLNTHSDELKHCRPKPPPPKPEVK